jgi:hypothetical protein
MHREKTELHKELLCESLRCSVKLCELRLAALYGSQRNKTKK